MTTLFKVGAALFGACGALMIINKSHEAEVNDDPEIRKEAYRDICSVVTFAEDVLTGINNSGVLSESNKTQVAHA